MEEGKKIEVNKARELICGVVTDFVNILKEVESKDKQSEYLANAILKESRERLSVPAYEGRSEAENTADWVVQSFSDYLDKMCYIRNINYLAKAVGFYLLHSKDNEYIKGETMKVFESVLENDEAYKEAHDYLFILRYAVEDTIKDKEIKENSNMESNSAINNTKNIGNIDNISSK